jgi:two-component system LytT family response regulator
MNDSDHKASPRRGMRVLIADDEVRARRRLKEILEGMSGVEICGEAEDGVLTLEAIEREHPDVVLLDVQMPGLDGFEVLRELSGPKVPLIIFVTGYDQYAIRAFEVSAVDFLLKPVSADRLEEALAKAGRILSRDSAFAGEEAMEQIRRLTEALAKGPSSYVQQLAGRRGAKFRVLPVASIEAFVCEDNQVYAVTGKERFMVNQMMKDLEARLDPQCFARVHRQAVVNLAHLAEIEPAPDGGATASLKSGLSLDVSRRYEAPLKEKLGW